MPISGPDARSECPGEQRHELDLRAEQELVDRADLTKCEAAVDQHAGVAGEALRMAGGVDHARNLGPGERGALLRGPGARWVENDELMVELAPLQWATHQVALDAR